MSGSTTAGARAVPTADELDFDKPDELDECDLVLKGGIASGLIYATSVPWLARRYRFRSIGGSSAGAVGAALAAAAEYQRATTDNPEGFRTFWKVGEDLTPKRFSCIFLPIGTNRQRRRCREELTGSEEEEPKPDLTKLRKLDIDARVLEAKAAHDKAVRNGAPGAQLVALRAAIARARGRLMPRKRSEYADSSVRRLVRYWLMRTAFSPRVHKARHKLARHPRLVTAAGLAMAAIPLTGPFVESFDGLEPWVAFALVVLVTLAALVVVTALSMLKRPGFGMVGGGALATWLYHETQRAAGRTIDQAPLTVGDLQYLPPDRRVTLRFMATDLTTAEPLTLPLSPEVHGYYFKLLEWIDLELFPPQIMRHLKTVSPPNQWGYSRLPLNELPVVVAARMSIATPLLFRAIPLYKPKRALEEFRPGNIRRHWISDGGISSNFPIHFFDAWLPTRPTLGLLLRSVDPEAEAIERSFPFHGVEISNAPSLLGRTTNALMNAADIAQAKLPGFGARVIDLPYDKRVGGANIRPDEDDLAEMRRTGWEEMDRWMTKPFDERAHRLARYELLMSLLRANLQPAQGVNRSLADSFDKKMQALLAARPDGPQKVAATRSLLEVAKNWGPVEGNVRIGRPPASSHEPVLRITPR